jgi:AcrR family transcriptional regulator
VATRAGVSRATLYQYFRSRPALVEAVCETFSESPAVAAIYASQTVAELLQHIVAFWSSEQRLFAALTGIAGVDPAAANVLADIVADRHAQVRRVVSLDAPGTPAATLALVTALTSFESYIELRRRAGLSETALLRALRDAAVRLLARA